MRLSILCEGPEAHKSLLEDGEGMTAGAMGDSNAASAIAPTGTSVPGVTTSADVAMYPKYLGFSYRGGTVKLRGKSKKRKSLHEETLNQLLGALLEDYSSRLSKNPEINEIADD